MCKKTLLPRFASTIRTGFNTSCPHAEPMQIDSRSDPQMNSLVSSVTGEHHPAFYQFSFYFLPIAAAVATIVAATPPPNWVLTILYFVTFAGILLCPIFDVLDALANDETLPKEAANSVILILFGIVFLTGVSSIGTSAGFFAATELVVTVIVFLCLWYSPLRQGDESADRNVIFARLLAAYFLSMLPTQIPDIIELFTTGSSGPSLPILESAKTVKLYLYPVLIVVEAVLIVRISMAIHRKMDIAQAIDHWRKQHTERTNPVSSAVHAIFTTLAIGLLKLFVRLRAIKAAFFEIVNASVLLYSLVFAGFIVAVECLSKLAISAPLLLNDFLVTSEARSWVILLATLILTWMLSHSTLKSMLWIGSYQTQNFDAYWWQATEGMAFRFVALLVFLTSVDVVTYLARDVFHFLPVTASASGLGTMGVWFFCRVVVLLVLIAIPAAKALKHLPSLPPIEKNDSLN